MDLEEKNYDDMDSLLDDFGANKKDNSKYSVSYELPKSQDYSNSKIIENYIIGNFLVKSQLIGEYFDLLLIDDFFFEENKELFLAIKKSIDFNGVNDLGLIKEYYIKNSKLSPSECFSKIDNLISYVNEINSELDNNKIIDKYSAYVKTLKVYSADRQTKEVFREYIKTNKKSPDDIFQNLQKISNKVSEISESAIVSTGSTLSVKDIMSEHFKKIKENIKNDSDDVSVDIPTGFSLWDETIGLFSETDMVVVPGRPSMGKTAMSVQMAINLAKKGMEVLYFSVEMDKTDITMRMLSNLSKISLKKIKALDLTKEEFIKVEKAIIRLEKLPIQINNSIKTVSELKFEHKKWYNNTIKGTNKRGIFIVDYLQKLEGDGKGKNRTEEISYISKTLKDIAKDFKTPAVVLAQLNRDLEKRPNKRPIMSDLRESGAIEQDADYILALYRDVVYNKSTGKENEIEIICLKNRNGPIGTIYMRCDVKYNIFIESEDSKFVSI